MYGCLFSKLKTIIVPFTDNEFGEAHRSTKHSFQHGHRGFESQAEPREWEAAGVAERAGQAGALRDAGVATAAAATRASRRGWARRRPGVLQLCALLVTVKRLVLCVSERGLMIWCLKQNKIVLILFEKLLSSITSYLLNLFIVSSYFVLRNRVRGATGQCF